MKHTTKIEDLAANMERDAKHVHWQLIWKPRLEIIRTIIPIVMVILQIIILTKV